MTLRDQRVRLARRDGSSVVPVTRELDDGRPGGHGLRIVDALADAWGIDERPDGGTTVWADLVGGPAAR